MSGLPVQFNYNLLPAGTYTIQGLGGPRAGRLQRQRADQYVPRRPHRWGIRDQAAHGQDPGRGISPAVDRRRYWSGIRRPRTSRLWITNNAVPAPLRVTPILASGGGPEHPHPNPSPSGRGAFLPSPSGRGWPGGPGEGANKQAASGHGPICITRCQRGELRLSGEGGWPPLPPSVVKPGRLIPQSAFVRLLLVGALQAPTPALRATPPRRGWGRQFPSSEGSGEAGGWVSFRITDTTRS